MRHVARDAILIRKERLSEWAVRLVEKKRFKRLTCELRLLEEGSNIRKGMELYLYEGRRGVD